jgi:hypothetical protein
VIQTYLHTLPLIQRQVAEDPDLWRRLSQQGQAAHQREWGVGVHLARYLAIIAEILEERATHAT